MFNLFSWVGWIPSEKSPPFTKWRKHTWGFPRRKQDGASRVSTSNLLKLPVFSLAPSPSGQLGSLVQKLPFPGKELLSSVARGRSVPGLLGGSGAGVASPTFSPRSESDVLPIPAFESFFLVFPTVGLDSALLGLLNQLPLYVHAGKC